MIKYFFIITSYKYHIIIIKIWYNAHVIRR
nr:MAG TPA: hypothetical protein [Caudoviricetes sp.]